MDKEITIKNGETEITINEQIISVSAPNISVTIMSDGKSTSVKTVTKDGIVSQVSQESKMLFATTDKAMTQTGKPDFNY